MSSNSEIDRLGQRIRESKGKVPDSDLDLLQVYRQSFQQPIANVFTFVLKAARKIDRQCVVTYRIKRIDTIIEKLQRFEENDNGSMRFSRMWDIAGCRCIMSTNDTAKLYLLLSEIKKEYGDNCKINDYVHSPKESGYQSLHVYVKDSLTQKPIEIQIRNKTQHNWATLVEIVDLLYGTNHKEAGAFGSLGRFLMLYSKAPRLSDKDFSEMLRIERRMRVFEKMSETLSRNYLNIRIKWLKQKQQGSFFVIAANRKGSDIMSFPSFKEAEDEYYRQYLNNRDCNIVLTHLFNPSFEQISMAYSNYILAMHSFFDDYRDLVAKKIVESVESGSILSLFQDFKIYNRNIKYHFKNLASEVKSIDRCKTSHHLSMNQLNKWMKEVTGRVDEWTAETKRFLTRLYKAANSDVLVRWLIRTRIRRMTKAILAGQRES